VTENIKSLVIKTPQGEKTVNNFTNNFYNLGSVSEESEDSKVNIEVTYKDGHTSPVPVKVYTCTDEEYQAVYEKLARNQLENVVETGNKVTGTIHVDEEGTLLLTIPYDIGWHILVDGEQVPTYRVGEALTGIDLGTGDHEIVMEFTPDGFRLGSIISLVCLVLFLLSCLMENFLKKRKKEKERDGDVYIFG
ncbi:MAG: YfhO family protein, partial [Muricoprocola sp.]